MGAGAGEPEQRSEARWDLGFQLRHPGGAQTCPPRLRKPSSLLGSVPLPQLLTHKKKVKGTATATRRFFL